MQRQSPPIIENTAQTVRNIFTRVAPYYDRMNDIASLGWHRHWKRHMIDRMQLKASGKRCIIDMACGSGDIALACAAQAHKDSHIYGLDANPSMLNMAQARASQQRHRPKLEFHHAMAEQVPLPDAIADMYVVAFGIRNFQSRAKALREAWRLLQPGGHFLCLEFSPFQSSLWGRLNGFWTRQIVPRLGELIAHDRDSYIYLRDSIGRFPKSDAWAKELRAAGFAHVRWQMLGGGIAALHEGWKF